MLSQIPPLEGDMKRPLGSILVGVYLALGGIAPAAAQWWPAYGHYGYGTGYDAMRNPYSYPRPSFAQSRSVPEDALSLYGGYMPNAYYTGGAYALSRATPFPSGQAYCETAGSYLYCADLESGNAFLLTSRQESAEQPRFSPLPLRLSDNAVYSGILATRQVSGVFYLVGSLRGPTGEELAIDCSGRMVGIGADLSCR